MPHCPWLSLTTDISRDGQTLRMLVSKPSQPLYYLNTLKLTQITHSEWASDASYSASAGAGLSASKQADNQFKRLPFNFCALSLQPFKTAVCTIEGTIFDLDNILSWLLKHGTNPVTGKKLTVNELIHLNFTKNEQGEFVDPVTFKVFTNNSHLVAIKGSGNVFAWDTLERLNIKAKLWRDLVTDEEFCRKDIITLQDPNNLDGRNLSSFKYVKDGVSTLTPEQERARNAGVNKSALGNAASMIKAKGASEDPASKPQVGRYLNQPASQQNHSRPATTSLTKPSSDGTASSTTTITTKAPSSKARTAHHTTGQAAASLTSTGLTPHTSSALAHLSEESYLLHPTTRIKHIGYATIHTTHGALTLSLLPQHAPRAVWNFIQLAKKGYYDGVRFHRNIKTFMLQGGDPTGTGRGGQSVWGHPFVDEWPHSPLSHDARGVVSMANKGRDTNTSQFFITYNACKHLDRKHTVFGSVVEGSETTLRAIEGVDVDGGKRPKEVVEMEKVEVLVDPFEEFLKEDEKAKEGGHGEGAARRGIDDDGAAVTAQDEQVTWTGKKVGRSGAEDGPGVGKYMGGSSGGTATKRDAVEEWEEAASEQIPVKKKVKGGGGFGNFDSW